VERLQIVDRLSLVFGLAGTVDVVREAGSHRRFGRLPWSGRIGVGQTVVVYVDGVAPGAVVRRVHLTDCDAGMCPNRSHESLAEAAAHVIDAKRRDGERLIERVAAVGPRIEVRREQDVEAAAVDGADSAADGVGRTLIVAVDDDGLLRSAEEFARLSGVDVFKRPVLGGRDGSTVGNREVRGLDGVDGGHTGRVGRAREHEHAALVCALGLRAEACRERSEGHEPGFTRPRFARFDCRVGR